MTDGPLAYVAVAFGLAGTILNALHYRACFALWLLSNAAMLTVMAADRHWALVAQYSVYTCLAVIGMRTWRRHPVAR